MPDVPVSPDSAELPSDGTVRPITRWGEDVMHRVQEPETDFDESLHSLVADMVATMYAADGVGLAACQVGEDVAMFVFDCPDDEGVHTVGELITRSEADLLDIRNFGQKSIDEVKAKLAEMGLALKDSPAGFDPSAVITDFDDDISFAEDEQY